MNKFSYPAEKLAAARRILMAPHPSGVAASYVGAFHECMLGLRDIRPSDLDDSASKWFGIIERTMDTKGIVDPDERGTFTIKAEKLTEMEMHDFSNSVDELAEWMDARS